MAEKTAVRPGEATAAWAWLLQRISAAFLLFFLGAHLWVLHFALGDERINFERVRERLHQPFYQVLDVVLLAVVLYHALYGVRSVIFDFRVQGTGKNVLTWGFVVLGLIGFIYGFITLQKFWSAS
ncbi:MAG: succinate dehydrogenase, hydrophobic membrane anchor protein [Dehalococcoidia bacterium]|nr:succinate dehydrogenase, hydrophobic membrane anchor protein [Dehalococcoidia bacterium]